MLAASDLAVYLRVDATQTIGLQAAIDAAEAAVATFMGLDTLAAAAIDVTLKPVRDSAFLDLRRGPLTAITSIARDGDAGTLTDYLATPWHVQALDVPFFVGEEVRLVYAVGWADADALAPDVRQAVLMTAAGIYNRPDAAASNIGIQGVTFFRPDYLSPTVKDILRRYQRRRL